MNMFNQVPLQRPSQSKFRPNFSVKGSMQPGYLYPVCTKEVLPGDSWQMDSHVMARMAPLVSPMMHEVDIKIMNFFCPYRLVWDEFPDYITKGRLGQSNPLHPYYNVSDGSIGNLGAGSLHDWMGFQCVIDETTGDITGPVTDGLQISALPSRVYREIWNQYFLNQNLEAPYEYSKASGDSAADFSELSTMKKRQWEADRFVSLLPFAQRGDTVVMPVDIEFEYRDGAEGTIIRNSASGTPVAGADLADFSTQSGTPPPVDGTVLSGAPSPVYFDNIESIEGTSLDINEFREALALQKWLENNARGGNLYIDQLLVRWGVKSSDARLQRPEYLGGGSAPMVISEVLSTAQFEGASSELPQGNMAGHGIAVGSSNGFRRYFEEHGCLMTLMCIIPRTGYFQGVDKMFTRLDSLDWANPEFANLGEEQVTRKEIYYDVAGAGGAKDTLLGYTPRFSDYKWFPSTVHGEFRYNLRHWHWARQFGIAPELNIDFVECSPDGRVFAVDTGDHFYVQVHHRISLMRKLPYYGSPGKMTV